MDPLQWMGAVRMIVQTVDENNNASYSNIIALIENLFVYNKKKIHPQDPF